MNKICTTIEQSQKLVELGIDVNTADTWYQYIGDSFKDGITKPVYFLMVMRDDPSEKDIPAWSLSALLNILPYPSLHSTFMGWRCDSYNKEGTSCIFGEDADNPVDTCYKMIVKLKNMH